jgi:hypothetical protein
MTAAIDEAYAPLRLSDRTLAPRMRQSQLGLI